MDRWQTHSGLVHISVPLRQIYAEMLAEREKNVGGRPSGNRSHDAICFPHTRGGDQKIDPSDMCHQGIEIEAIEKARARARQGTRTDLKSNIVDICPPSLETGEMVQLVAPSQIKTRDLVAAAVGLGSGETYRKAKTVWTAAQEGDPNATERAEQRMLAGKKTDPPDICPEGPRRGC